jgi:hypothetical protein
MLLHLSGAAYNFAGLTNANGTFVNVTGTGASAAFGVLTTLADGGITLSGDGTVAMDKLANVDGSILIVSGGVTLALPEVKSYTHTAGDVQNEVVLRASGGGVGARSSQRAVGH